MKNKLHVHWASKSDPHVINLDPDFAPVQCPHLILETKSMAFPGGEQHFQIVSRPEFEGDLIITQRVNNTSDFMKIILANNAAREMGYSKIQLVCPYFPGARQDRVCNVGESLTVKVFADLINSCRFKKVWIYDPHSDVTCALINNCCLMDLTNDFAEQIVSEEDDDVVNIVCPDAGAGKRVLSIVKYLYANLGGRTFNLIRCEKVRDASTGQLKEFHVQADDLGNHRTIIFDDINCWGGTFLGLGKVLKTKNCAELELFTSHSDCLSGIENVCGFFDTVYTTNSKQNWKDYNFPACNRLKCFDIKI